MNRAFSETPGDRKILDSGDQESAVCPDCKGQGELEDEEFGCIQCPVCQGRGEITEREAKDMLAAWRAEQQPQGD